MWVEYLRELMQSVCVINMDRIFETYKTLKSEDVEDDI